MGLPYEAGWLDARSCDERHAGGRRQADGRTDRRTDSRQTNEAGRWIGKRAGRQAGRQANRQTKHTGRHAYGPAWLLHGYYMVTTCLQTDRQAGRKARKQAARQAGRQAGRQVGREAGREAGRKAGRQVGRKAGRKAAKADSLSRSLLQRSASARARCNVVALVVVWRRTYTRACASVPGPKRGPWERRAPAVASDRTAPISAAPTRHGAACCLPRHCTASTPSEVDGLAALDRCRRAASASRRRTASASRRRAAPARPSLP